MTMQQARDFRDESDALAAVLEGRPDADWSRPTLFKDWTANDIIRHLHFWNRLANLALTDPDGFQALRRRFREKAATTGHRAAEASMSGDLGGQALLGDWRGFYHEMAERWAGVDPRQCVPWVGPKMSARSSITVRLMETRLMETWAHGQAVFDLFGLAREEHDRLRNVVVLGVNTWGSTWAVRERKPPGPIRTCGSSPPPAQSGSTARKTGRTASRGRPPLSPRWSPRPETSRTRTFASPDRSRWNGWRTRSASQARP